MQNLKALVTEKVKEKYLSCDNTVAVIREQCELKIQDIERQAADLTCRLTGRVEDCEQLISSRVTEDYVQTFGRNLTSRVEEMLNRKASGQIEQSRKV